ncbi:MAG: excinuclease ABC subunit UvrA [Planctomycetes bacterium]|nr:excinuclease ABC subunit UvrA [Planctomycetota bacterium]
MAQDRSIVIRGARQHNLRDVSLSIPRDKLVVITGLSGSGKSSLAFDTIYAEGQRRYVESLSAYARQFLEQLQKPDVDSIEGLPPTISIEQRAGHATPRSTVATSTEIYDYLRLLFARVGHPSCYKCGRPITQQTPEQVVDALLGFRTGTKLVLLAPLVRGKKGSHREVFDRIRREGFVRVRVDAQIHDLKDVVMPDKNKKHEIEAVVDRLLIEPGLSRRRMTDSVETALKLGEGLLIAGVTEPGRPPVDRIFSEKYACPHCGVSFGELQPRLFSFNSPYGACPTCDGLGTRPEIDEDLVVPDKSKSIRDGAVEPWRRLGRRMTIRYGRRLREFCDMFGVKYGAPFEKLDAAIRRILLHGTTADDEKQRGAWFEGVIPSLMHRFEHTESDFIKRRILAYMSDLPCPDCKGRRLRPEALSVRVGEKNIDEGTRLTIEQAISYFGALELTKEERAIARLILREIRGRLQFLADVGLGYLTLDRKSSTLAGGEAQRIRLASQVGSGLVGVCYVLDEPTIGLHERDTRRLLDTLVRLRDLGNTVLVVEHDEDTIRTADHIVDIGPGAGLHGGEIVAQGTLQEIMTDRRSMTGKFLSGEERIPVPVTRRVLRPERAVEVRGARENNLKNIAVRFPLGGFVCVTGVSGSGKSTLVHEILYKGLARLLGAGRDKPGAHDRISGYAAVEKVMLIDQSPIGRTSRSNPVTYTGVFDEIRRLYAMTKEAKARGYAPGRFSFNVKGGRCEACEGQGTKVIEMHFLPDVYVVCEECKGRRYNRETLEVKYKGKDIAEILDLPIEQALEFFANYPKIKKWLQTLDEVGLGYMAAGQSSTTLSGGEAQRVKLAAELGRGSGGHTLYILDEPTTGLHFADIQKLLAVLHRLSDAGHSVVVIEHNMHVIKTADWLIDLGPEGGEGGGRVVVCGTPENVVRVPESHTGRLLRPYLSDETLKWRAAGS